MINAIGTALSGLMAASKRVEASANNIANISTSGALTPENGPAPYNAQTTIQSTQNGSNGEVLGVKATNIPKDPGFVTAYDPGSPFADDNGLIGVPAVNLTEEAVNLKLAEITYKANAKVLQVTSELSKELINTVDKNA